VSCPFVHCWSELERFLDTARASVDTSSSIYDLNQSYVGIVLNPNNDSHFQFNSG